MRFISCITIIFLSFNLVSGQCIYNLTHCSCTTGTNSGKCLRTATDSTCLVDMCAPEGLVCDCTGTSMCELYTCTAMQAENGMTNNQFNLGELVSCEPFTTYCLQKQGTHSSEDSIGDTPTTTTSFSPSSLPTSSPLSTMQVQSNSPSEPSSTAMPAESPMVSTSAQGPSQTSAVPSSSNFSLYPSPSISSNVPESTAPLFSPILTITPSPTATALYTYRNVQFGTENLLENSFNLNPFADSGNNLRTSSLSAQWADGLTERRMITFRFYVDPIEQNKQMICAIYNPNTGIPDEFVEEISVKATVSSGTFDNVTWTYCDDSGECQGSSSETTLLSAHITSSDESDGFCIGDLDNSNDYLTVTFTEVTGVRGIAFEEPNQIVKQYNWADMGLPEAGGLVGAWTSLEGNLVYFGVSPEIRFSWGGIPVPL